MKKITLLTVLLLFGIATIQAQFTFKFNYVGLSPSCNPFKDSPNSFNPSNQWKVSHGTPNLVDYNSQNFFNVGRLAASKSVTGVEKSEGLFTDYKFLCNHVYTIIVGTRLSSNSPSQLGINIYAANGLTENSNTNCELDDIPSVSEKKLIYGNDIQVPDPGIGAFGSIEITNWRPDKDYKSIWILSRQNYISNSGSLLLNDVTIFDNGPVPGASPCTVVVPPIVVPPTTSSLLVVPFLEAYATNGGSVTLVWGVVSRPAVWKIESDGYFWNDPNRVIGYRFPFFTPIYNTDNQPVYDYSSNTYSYTINNLQICQGDYLFKLTGFDCLVCNTNKAVTTVKSVLFHPQPFKERIDIGFNYNTPLPFWQQIPLINKASKEIHLIPGFRSVVGFKAKIENCDTGPTGARIDNISEPLVSIKTIYPSVEKPKSDNDTFTVFPNPVDNRLQISTESSRSYSISLFDILGVLLSEKANIIGQSELDFSSYTQGIYLLDIRTESGEIIQRKIVK
jgi:hypothetical protein